MKPELNPTQAIYPPEGPKPKVCVTTTNAMQWNALIYSEWDINQIVKVTVDLQTTLTML